MLVGPAIEAFHDVIQDCAVKLDDPVKNPSVTSDARREPMLVVMEHVERLHCGHSFGQSGGVMPYGHAAASSYVFLNER